MIYCFFGIIIVMTASYSVASAFQSSFIYIKPPCRRYSSLLTAAIDDKRYQVSKDILQGLQTSTSSGNLNIVLDFFDDSTGLYSEGVWHNCLAGIASLQLRKIHRHNQQKYLDDAMRIANSIFNYSWDGTSFRRRAWSGNWDHTRLLEDDNDIEQANYYLESSEHRCIQHAIAVIFWSMLSTTNSSSTIHNQQSLILKQFIDQFWNGKRWTTISKSQGSGTTLRPSASSGKTTNTESTSDNVPYYRAVDQALAVLALLEHIKLLDNTGKKATRKSEREHIVHIIKTTCKGILNDFGYNELSTARTYLGINRNRNFWHEGWAILALSCAHEYVWPMDTREGHLQLLWNGIEKLYTTSSSIDGEGNNDVGYTIYHWPISEKDVKLNVRYCGDNTLAYAIRRSMRYETANGNEKDAAFWRFIDMLRSNGNRDGHDFHHLASVADVYTQVRLHPNTELAALLLWPT